MAPTMYEENTSSKSSLTFVLYICGFLVLFLIAGLIFLFTKLTDTREEYSEEISECQQEKLQLVNEQKVGVCTYGRYGIEYTDEELAEFKIYVYRHIEETEDGYLELILRLNKEEESFKLEIKKENVDPTDPIEIDGEYTEAEDVLTLEYDGEKEVEIYTGNSITVPSKLEFTIIDTTLDILEYTGDSFTGGYPQKGDKYYFYWVE